jgi:hypothetical protein
MGRFFVAGNKTGCILIGSPDSFMDICELDQEVIYGF